jgi:hypothetical protein
VACKSPITIDKREAWGDAPANFQDGINGAFLKMKSPTEVSHLVQPKPDWSAPEGWVPTGIPGIYDKSPIWIEERVIPAGEVTELKTADNAKPLEYRFDAPSVICYNTDANDQPNPKDAWVQKLTDLMTNYEYEPAAAAKGAD